MFVSAAIVILCCLTGALAIGEGSSGGSCCFDLALCYNWTGVRTPVSHEVRSSQPDGTIGPLIRRTTRKTPRLGAVSGVMRHWLGIA